MRVLLGAALTDQILRDKFPDGFPRERAVDLELLGDNGGGDELLLGHVGQHLLVGGLVEEHKVGELLLHLTLGPLLRKSRGEHSAQVKGGAQPAPDQHQPWP